MHDARAIANALITRGLDTAQGLAPLQIIKMTYLCHGWMLGLHHRAMSRQPVEAWQYGPVVPAVYHAVKRYGTRPVRTLVRTARTHAFDPLEDDLIEQVLDVYGQLSGIELATMTCTRGSPWHRTHCEKGRDAPIPDAWIEEYFAADAARRQEPEVVGHG